MGGDITAQVDPTAARVALWRALHVLIDAAPHVVTDLVGLQLLDPPQGWQQRGDMHPIRSARARASIVARARLIEDEIDKAIEHGVRQIAILGAGLDSTAQRRTDLASHVEIFEIDAPRTQAWKRERLLALGVAEPDLPTMVPVDFERGENWVSKVVQSGFRTDEPSIIVAAGLSMYLSESTNAQLLRDISGFAPATRLVLTFALPRELIDVIDRPGHAAAEKGAKASGHPWRSHFSPDDMAALIARCGLRSVRFLLAADLGRLYFQGRADSLAPATTEAVFIAQVPN